MVRSKLSQKFTLHEWQLFERKFKEQYKQEEGKQFKGNVAQHVTVGVIQRKRLPDLEDVLSLIKLGNINCSDNQAEAVLEGWLNDDENKKRGIAGAFCDICKDLSIDIPIHPLVVKQINEMEETINKMQDTMSQLAKMIESLGNIKERIDEENNKTDDTIENKEELEVDIVDTQEDK